MKAKKKKKTSYRFEVINTGREEHGIAYVVYQATVNVTVGQ